MKATKHIKISFLARAGEHPLPRLKEGMTKPIKISFLKLKGVKHR